MRYPQAFLDIQLTFAQKMAQLARQPYQDSVRIHTTLYRIFGLDWEWKMLLSPIPL